MNRNDFTGIINNSSIIDRQLIGEVRELLDLFPYFQSAHLMLLKGLHNISDVKFESQLKQSAIHIADREVLYHLLTKKPHPVTEPTESDSSVKANNEVISDSRLPVIESDINSGVLIHENESNHSEAVVEANTEFSANGIPRSLLFPEESDDDDIGNVVFLLDYEAGPVDEEVMFLDPTIPLPFKNDLLELDLQDEISSSADEGNISAEKEKVEEKKSVKELQEELINKFIITNPRIEQVKDKTDFQMTDISKPYTEEKGGFITETLAKIYVTQGYYSRAIDIYEKLCLKFPEKSSYFATQIEKVKELIK
jgi:hypothetical protein